MIENTGKNISFYRIAAAVFLAEIVYMALELLAARMMSPFFGNTNAVWTAVIGIILASSALGNWLGGKVADGNNPVFAFSGLLLASGAATALIPPLSQASLQMISAISPDVRIGAVIATTLLFFLPSLLLGTIIPIAVGLVVDDVETVGRKSGSIYAVSTVGGIAGTFLAGFFLIPSFDASAIVFACAALLCLLPILVPVGADRDARKEVWIPRIAGIVTAVLLIAASATTEISGGTDSGNYHGMETIYEGDSEYNRIQIMESTEKTSGKPIRMMRIGIGGYQSITYTDEDKYDFPFKGEYYTEYYDRCLDSQYVDDADDNKKILMIGGGGYSYPKHCIASSKNSIDVVELDPTVTKLAREYFFLDDLIEDYGLDPEGKQGRLKLISGDGRVFLNEHSSSQDQNAKYDRIFNDAFAGKTPPAVLASVEAVKAVKGSLTENGIYATNIIGSASGEGSRFLKAEVNTIAQVFKHVYLFPTTQDYQGDDHEGNWMVLATDADTRLSVLDWDVDYSDGLVLTDSYCPVESLSGEYASKG